MKQPPKTWSKTRPEEEKTTEKLTWNGFTPPPSGLSPPGFLVRDQELNLHLWHPGVGGRSKTEPRSPKNPDPSKITILRTKTPLRHTGSFTLPVEALVGDS